MGGFGFCKAGLCVFGLMTALAAGAQSQERVARVRVRDGAVAAALKRAIEHARRRLAEPECRKLFSDFTDASGRPLQAVLDEAGQSPEQYVEQLLFYDGSAQQLCSRSAVRAVTAPGSRVIFVCAREFSSTRNSGTKGGDYDFVVIHEMLHSLGLEEDPPSSSDINARVRARCSS